MLVQGDTWTRVSGVHGQTLLSLGFNYRILSLSTLTFGTDKMTVNVTDRPRDCMTQLNETDKVRTVLRLLVNDFETEKPTVDPSNDHYQYQVEFFFISRRCDWRGVCCGPVYVCPSVTSWYRIETAKRILLIVDVIINTLYCIAP